MAQPFKLGQRDGDNLARGSFGFEGVGHEFGVEIEEVAAKTPEAIFKEVLDGVEGITEDVAKRLCGKLGLSGRSFWNGVEEMQKLWKLFVGSDATQVEVNPLAETADGRIITGRGPGFAFDFGFAILTYLKGESAAAEVRKGMLI